MKLKCIGGEFDGKWKDVSPDLSNIGNTVRFYKLPKAVVNYNLRDPVEEAITMQIYYYTVDCFHFSKDDVYKFLRPSEWTNKQAILHQFSK